MNPEEFADSTKVALKKAEKAAVFSLEGIMSLGTAIAGVVVSIVPWGDTTSQVIGLVAATAATLFMAHKRGKLKEMLVSFAGEAMKHKG